MPVPVELMSVRNTHHRSTIPENGPALRCDSPVSGTPSAMPWMRYAISQPRAIVPAVRGAGQGASSHYRVAGSKARRRKRLGVLQEVGSTMTPLGLGLMLQIGASGRMVSLAESPSQRIAAFPKLAPGQPPLLSFRYFEGKDRRRFTGLDLVLDNAGH